MEDPATLLRVHRARANVSQIEVAATLGVSIATIQRYEAGTGLNHIRPATLLAMATMLRLTPGELAMAIVHHYPLAGDVPAPQETA